MIITFKLFENQSYYLINIDLFWQAYRENYYLLYPNEKKPDSKIPAAVHGELFKMMSSFRKDIVKTLIGKQAEVTIATQVVDNQTLTGQINDVFVRFDSHRKIDPDWEFKVKINKSGWLILDSLMIKIFSPKTEFENNIFKFLNFKRFDL